MKRLPPIILVALCLLLYGCDEPAMVSHESDAAALSSAKGHKGGGKDPPPGGTVYFWGDDGAISAIHQMDAGGGSVATFPASVTGFPSREDHGGLRWFLHVEPVAGTYTDGVPREEVFATGAQAGAGSTTTVQLTDDPAVHPRDNPRNLWWSPGDAKIGFKGRRLDATGRVTEGGLFTLDVTFDTGVPTPVGSPVLAVSTAISTKEESCVIGSGQVCEVSLLAGFDWSPNLDRIAYGEYDETGSSHWIRITGSEANLATGWAPRWSPPAMPDFPDGRIIFNVDDNRQSLWTIRPDGSDLQRVVRIKNPGGRYVGRWVDYPAWSPAGEHFVHRWLEINFSTGRIQVRVYRVQADGTDSKCLTCRDFDKAEPKAWW